MSAAGPMGLIGREGYYSEQRNWGRLTPRQKRRVRHKANRSGEWGPPHPSEPGKGRPTPRRRRRVGRG